MDQVAAQDVANGCGLASSGKIFAPAVHGEERDLTGFSILAAQ